VIDDADLTPSLQELFDTMDHRRAKVHTVLDTDDGDAVYVTVDFPRGRGIDALKALAVVGSKKSLLGFLASGAETDPSLDAFLAEHSTTLVEIQDKAVEAYADGPLTLADAGDLSV
jgi:hypothetical protein